MFLSRQLAVQAPSLPLGLGLSTYSMPTQNKQNYASVCTPDGFAMKARVARLARELKRNLTGK